MSIYIYPNNLIYIYTLIYIYIIYIYISHFLTLQMFVFDKLLEVVIPPPKPPVPYQVHVSCSLGSPDVLCLYDVEHHCILIYICLHIFMFTYVSIYIYIFIFTVT